MLGGVGLNAWRRRKQCPDALDAMLTGVGCNAHRLGRLGGLSGFMASLLGGLGGFMASLLGGCSCAWVGGGQKKTKKSKTAARSPLDHGALTEKNFHFR